MTIKLNSVHCRYCCASKLKSSKVIVTDPEDKIVEFPTYWSVGDDYNFPKLFYKEEVNGIYPIFTARDSGDLDSLIKMGVV